MDTPHSNAMPIDHGPMAGWDISITHIPHGIDAMDDLYVLDLWTPGADHADHTFETYRHAYGWNTLNTALTGDDDAMQAALDWWTTNHTTHAYAAHRILVAIDITTWATKTEIANRLVMAPTELDADHPYGRALAATNQHHLTTWRNRRTTGSPDSTPLVALTPAAYDLIHPDDANTAAKSQQWFTTTFNTADAAPQSAEGTRSRASNAFPLVRGLQPVPAPQIDTPPPAMPQPVRPTR